MKAFSGFIAYFVRSGNVWYFISDNQSVYQSLFVDLLTSIWVQVFMCINTERKMYKWLPFFMQQEAFNHRFTAIAKRPLMIGEDGITKEERGLSGDTHCMAMQGLAQEKHFSHQRLPWDKADCKVRFNPTAAVSLGGGVNNNLFAEHAWHFLRASIRANYRNGRKSMELDMNFLTLSFRDVGNGRTQRIREAAQGRESPSGNAPQPSFARFLYRKDGSGSPCPKVSSRPARTRLHRPRQNFPDNAP